MKIRFLKEIEILGEVFKIKWNKSESGGCCNWAKNTIEVGTHDYVTNPNRTFDTLNHELMELIMIMTGMRYENPRIENVFLFNFEHQQFELFVSIYSQTISKFIIKC